MSYRALFTSIMQNLVVDESPRQEPPESDHRELRWWVFDVEACSSHYHLGSCLQNPSLRHFLPACKIRSLHDLVDMKFAEEINDVEETPNCKRGRRYA